MDRKVLIRIPACSDEPWCFGEAGCHALCAVRAVVATRDKEKQHTLGVSLLLLVHLPLA